MATRMVTCPECKDKLHKEDGVYEKPHYYHTDCYAKKLIRRELFDYICRLMNLKNPGPIIYAQRKKYINEYGYTDEGILNTLKYIYEVKHMSVQKADERIGLVPYYYDKAQSYFAQKEKEKVKIMNSMSAAVTNSVNETLVVNTKTDIKRKPVLINPMDWWEEEDESSR